MSSYFLSEANKLKNIQAYLEKNNNLLKYLSKYDDKLHLCDYFVDLEKERTTETEKLSNELKDIWKFLNIKKKLLKEEDINCLDLRSFKKDMIELQEKIQNLKIKLKTNIEILRDQENDIWEINETYTQRLAEWDKPLNYLSSISHKINNNISTSSSNKEIKEFMDFVNKSNGHENGWSSEDHRLFLKFRNKYKDIENLATNLNKLLPDISVDLVKKHEVWYKKYLLLKNKKEAALERWRQAKNENNCQEAANEDGKLIIKTNIFFKPRDEKVQQKIALWKAEKEARHQREHVFEQMKMEKIKQIQDEKRKLHQEVKKSVESWKESKLIKEQNEKFQKEMMEYQEKRIRATEANKLIKQFQSQDDIFIARLKYSRLEQKKEVKRSKSSYTVNRDPERVLKPTKQWLQRIAKDNFMEAEAPVFVPNIRVVPKLRMPDWRKNT